MMVSETASDEVVMNLTERIPQVQKNYEIPSVRLFRILHHKVEQLSMFKNPILAMCEAFLNVIVMVIIFV